MRNTIHTSLALSLLFAGCGDDETGGDATAGSSSGTAGSTSASTTTAGTTSAGTTTDATGDTGMTTGLACTPPEEDCGGVCVDTTTSLEHCGMCDNACPTGPDGTQVCEGTCGFTCDSGFGDCDPAVDGCENTLDSLENCGMCGRACMMGDTCTEPDCVGSRELVMNGDFAVAALADWTTANNPDEVATCDLVFDDTNIVFTEGAGGGYASAISAVGPHAHILFQDITVPVGLTTATLSFDYAQNNFPEPLDPVNVQTIIKDCLDENMDGNDENAFRVDIIDPAADQFLAPILFEVATPELVAGDPQVPTFVTLINNDPALLTFLQGQEGNTLRLRIAQVASTFGWPIAIDNVSLAVDVAY